MRQIFSRKWVRVVTISAAALIFLIGIISAVAAIYINQKLNMISYQNLDDEWVISGSDEELVEEYLSVTDLAVGETEMEFPDEKKHKDKNITNILLLGTDERGSKLSRTSRSDVVMLLSIDNKNGKIKLISFERAIPVKMPNGQKSLLGNSFHYGGPKYVISEIQSHFNVDVDKYVRVNFSIFKKIIDAVGGVDITLTEKEAKALNHEIRTNTAQLSRKVESGKNHLNGFEALQYSRLRYIDSDWARIKRQRKVIKAIQSQAKTLSVSEIDGVANEILPLIQTNMEKSEITSLLLNAPKMLKYSIDDMTIPQKGTYTGVCSNVNYKKNSQIIEEFIYQ